MKKNAKRIAKDQPKKIHQPLTATSLEKVSGGRVETNLYRGLTSW
jgi:hypothetical protein